MAPDAAPPAERPPRRGTRRRTPKTNPDFVSTLGFTDEDFDVALEASSVSSGSVEREVAEGERGDPAIAGVQEKRRKTQVDVRGMLKARKGGLRAGAGETKRKKRRTEAHAAAGAVRQSWRTMFASELPLRKRRRLRYMRKVHPPRDFGVVEE